jgi:hypothetical protein
MFRAKASGRLNRKQKDTLRAAGWTSSTAGWWTLNEAEVGQ